MKYALCLVALTVGCVIAASQTNIINIYNSRVIINNITPTQPITNVVVTNVATVKTNKMVVIPPEHLERLRWESMLEQRRKAAFKSYLKRTYK